jgi:hypothetical protein
VNAVTVGFMPLSPVSKDAVDPDALLTDVMRYRVPVQPSSLSRSCG